MTLSLFGLWFAALTGTCFAPVANQAHHFVATNSVTRTLSPAVLSVLSVTCTLVAWTVVLMWFFGVAQVTGIPVGTPLAMLFGLVVGLFLTRGGHWKVPGGVLVTDSQTRMEWLAMNPQGKLGRPASPSAIEAAEAAVGPLPSELKSVLSQFNGYRLNGVQLFPLSSAGVAADLSIVEEFSDTLIEAQQRCRQGPDFLFFAQRDDGGQAYFRMGSNHICYELPDGELVDTKKPLLPFLRWYSRLPQITKTA